jgi:hypothetical protein
MTLTVRPTRLSLAVGVAVIALWALLWAWFLLGIAQGPQKPLRPPELTELSLVQRATGPV